MSEKTKEQKFERICVKEVGGDGGAFIAFDIETHIVDVFGNNGFNVTVVDDTYVPGFERQSVFIGSLNHFYIEYV